MRSSLPWVPPVAPGAGDGIPEDVDPFGTGVDQVPVPTRPARRWLGLVAGVAAITLAAGSLGVVLNRQLNPAHQTQRKSPNSSPHAAPVNPAQQLQQVASQDLSGIVEIVAVGVQSQELGTGWPVDNRGDFITNDHVVHDGLSFHVVTASGAEYPARVVHVDAALDLAEVRVVGLLEQPLPVDPGMAVLGQPVVVLAAQGATGRAPVTTSSVNGLNERATVQNAQPGELSGYTDLIRIPAHVFPGNSGGPMLTTSGQVVGILTLAAQNGSGAFAIPLAEVYPVIQQWLISKK
ncbi:MAG: S1C family serine protease [Candidatus Dormibacteria bacterium]